MDTLKENTPNIDLNEAIVCIRRCNDILSPKFDEALTVKYPKASKKLMLSYLASALKALGASK